MLLKVAIAVAAIAAPTTAAEVVVVRKRSTISSSRNGKAVVLVQAQLVPRLFKNQKKYICVEVRREKYEEINFISLFYLWHINADIQHNNKRSCNMFSLLLLVELIYCSNSQRSRNHL